MIDLHSHTIFSDGVLIPAELARRAVAAGYEALAFTDHMDHSNIDLIIPRLVKVVNALKDHMPVALLPGAEITHVPPALIGDLVKEARKLGARIVIVHGETIVEPVIEGTNRTQHIQRACSSVCHAFGYSAYDQYGRACAIGPDQP